MIAIIDYGMGNLRSVQKALEAVGSQAIVTSQPADLLRADKIILPGVGAMKPAMDRLNELKLIESIKQVVKSGKSFLGICLGYQLFFEESSEGGKVKGLGIIPGTVERFSQGKVPHMGWNQLQFKTDCPLWANLPSSADVYFCHSYYVKPKDQNVIAATTQYGIPFASAIWNKNVFGLQFHPEKSQAYGLKILENFVRL